MWISVVLSFLLVETLGGGLVAIWSGFLIVAPFMAVLHSWRFKRTILELQALPPGQLAAAPGADQPAALEQAAGGAKHGRS